MTDATHQHPEQARWVQRLNNYQKALNQLDEACQLYLQRPLSNLEQQGLIQAFEYTFELVWNLQKDYLLHQGIQGMVGSRDVFRQAFTHGLIEDGEVWMQMIRDRNKTSHTYDETLVKQVVKVVVEHYLPQFLILADKMQRIRGQN